MHADKTISPLQVVLRPSQLLLRLIAITHLMALAAALMTPLLWPLKVALSAAIAASFVYYHRQLRHENRMISFNQARGWQLTRDGVTQALQVAPTTIVTPWATFLHGKSVPAILIAKDALDEDDYRQLIVKLKITVKLSQ